MIDYSKYFANHTTPAPNITLDQAFEINAFRSEQFDDITLNPLFNDSYTIFTELERRVELKKQEMGIK